jgi:RNA polymerase sigma-70 factor (ECF subfamily)
MSRQALENGRLFFRLAYDVLRNASEAEDVVQQSLLKAWERRDGRIKAPLQLKQWLVRSVVNGALEVLRRRKTEQRVLRLHPAADGDDDKGPSPPGDGPERVETADLLLRAVADLPEMTRSVIVLRILEGMSGNDAKDLLGCSAAEVSRQLHRGLEILRAALSRALPSYSRGA